MIVDFHTHILPPSTRDRREAYSGRDSCFGILYNDPKAKIATAEEMVANMDKEGIGMSVVQNIGWSSQELCRETNDYILESIARYPDRLVGFCAVQPLAGDEAVKEIERCAKAGARGVGELRPDTQGFDITDAGTMKPLVEAMLEHSMVLCTHCSEPVGHEYAGKGSVTPDQLYAFILNFPEMLLVCAHWGGGLPFYGLMPEVKAALDSTYFDTAASPFLYSPQIFEHVAAILGPERILFGSDHPLMRQRRVIESLDGLDLSEQDRELILGGNACRLLSLG